MIGREPISITEYSPGTTTIWAERDAETLLRNLQAPGERIKAYYGVYLPNVYRTTILGRIGGLNGHSDEYVLSSELILNWFRVRTIPATEALSFVLSGIPRRNLYTRKRYARYGASRS